MELIFYIDSLYCSIEVAAYEKGFLLFDNFLPKFDQLVTVNRASNLACIIWESLISATTPPEQENNSERIVVTLICT